MYYDLVAEWLCGYLGTIRLLHGEVILLSETSAEDLRLPYEGGWIFGRRPDGEVPRIPAPRVLTLDQSVDWIQSVKPILWTGSMLSVPPPSNFPSGLTVGTGLLQLMLGEPPEDKADMFTLLARQWPLEVLLDELDSVADNCSRSLLTFFRQHDAIAMPNPLHFAIVDYYRRGLAYKPLCVTVNWDTLQEKAFRESNFDVVVGSPNMPPAKGFGESEISDRLFIYHPHGSFDHEDVVCSHAQEVRQLAGSHAYAYLLNLIGHPTLFLGYSGYEPSMYDYLLMRREEELWCVRTNNDLELPLKRRLLSRPGVYVYVGDLRDLLKALGLLHGNIEFLPDKMLQPAIPMSRAAYGHMQLVTLARANANFCATELIRIVASESGESESNYVYNSLMKILVNHMRDTPERSDVLAALLAAAGIRNTPQTWINVLACLLRSVGELEPRVINLYLERARKALGDRKRIYSKRDLGSFSLGVVRGRTEIYRHYLGYSTRFDGNDPPNWEWIHSRPNQAFADLGATGEFMEVLAFLTLRQGDFELASRYFDYAADQYYLQGLWRAGARVEWASTNTEQLLTAAHAGSLAIRPTEALP